jgi:hypothetical protein
VEPVSDTFLLMRLACNFIELGRPCSAQLKVRAQTPADVLTRLPFGLKSGKCPMCSVFLLSDDAGEKCEGARCQEKILQ